MANWGGKKYQTVSSSLFIVFYLFFKFFTSFSINWKRIKISYPRSLFVPITASILSQNASTFSDISYTKSIVTERQFMLFQPSSLSCNERFDDSVLVVIQHPHSQRPTSAPPSSAINPSSDSCPSKNGG